MTRLVLLDALRTWVIPTMATATGLAVFVVHNLGVIAAAPAVTIIGGLGLLLVLFFGLRSFFEERVGPQLAVVLTGFATLWGIGAFYPFYRALNPGTPVFTTELQHNGPPVTVPLRAKPGRYNVVVEGHFLPAEGRQNRTATYRIAVGHDGNTDHYIEGTFSQEWRQQRVGSGRRSSLVPTMSQTTQRRDTLDDSEGRDITMTLTDLSPGVRDTVAVGIYTQGAPSLLLVTLGAFALVAAILVDLWRPKGANEGLMATLTMAAFVAILVFRMSSVSTLGFPQLIIAALAGTLAGAIGGPLFWRLARPLRKHVRTVALLSLLVFEVLSLGAPARAVQSAPESFASVARAAKPAVVNIFPTRIVRMRGAQDPFDEFFRQFFGEVPPPRQQQQQSLGSGFIISPDGYIVTNAQRPVTSEPEQESIGVPEGPPRPQAGRRGPSG